MHRVAGELAQSGASIQDDGMVPGSAEAVLALLAAKLLPHAGGAQQRQQQGMGGAQVGRLVGGPAARSVLPCCALRAWVPQVKLSPAPASCNACRSNVLRAGP